MFKILTKLILGTSLLAAFFPPGVPSVAPFPVSGSKSVGYAPIVQADGTTVSWASPGGGGGLTYDGTIGDGQFGIFDDATDTYIPTTAGAKVYDVTNFIGGIRAAGSDTETTGTITGGTASLAVASGTSFERGHKIVIPGAGANHSLSTPAAPVVIPLTQTKVIDNKTSYTLETAVTWTANTTADTIACSAQLAVANGTGVIFSNQGGALPQHTVSTAFTETSTTYYLSNVPEVQTLAVSGTPQAGTYRILDGDSRNYVDVAYNANSAAVQTALRTLPGFGSVTVAESGSTPNFTHTITFTGVPGNRAQIQGDKRLMMDFGGTPAITVATTTDGCYKVHDTAPHAVAGTNVYDLTNAGTGTHYISVVGSTSYEYDQTQLSGDGGYTAESADGTTTTGNATLDACTHNFVAVVPVTGEKGVVLYGDSTTDANRYAVAQLNGIPTCKAIQADTAGYTAPEIGDIGRTFVQGSHDGKILAIDFTNKVFYVDPTSWADDTFPGGAAVSWTITGGTGAGTQTTAASNRIHWRDRGASETFTPHARLGRRNTAEYQVGDVMLYPVSSSGQFWRCIRRVGDGLTASSAPGGLTTSLNNLGDEVADGNVWWRRVNLAFPPTQPAAAVFDAFRGTVASRSSNTITLTGNVTTSVTSKPVWHDDWDAISAWADVARGTSSTTPILFFPGGRRFNLIPGQPTQEGGSDSRWYSIEVGGNYYDHSMFRMTQTSGTAKPLEWWAYGATIQVLSLDSPAKLLDDSGDASLADVRKFGTITGNDMTFRGGEYVYSPLAEPVLEHEDGWNFFTWLAPQSVNGPTVIDTWIEGFPRTQIASGTRGTGQGELWRNVHVIYGGGDHDAAFYTKGGRFEGCSVTRDLGRYSGSDLFYQDANSITQPLEIIGGTYEYGRKDCFRFRAADSRLIGAKLNRCAYVKITDTADNLIMSECEMSEGTIQPVGHNITLSNLQLTDCTVSIGTGAELVTLNHVISTTPYGLCRMGSGEALLQVAGGAKVHVDDCQFVAQHGIFGNQAILACILASGTIDEVRVSNSRFQGNKDQGCYFNGFAGALYSTNTYWGGATGPEACTFTMASGGTWRSENDTFDATFDTANDIAFNGGGRTELINPRFKGQLVVNTGMTGPVIIRGGYSESSSASTIAEPGTTIEDHDFAVAPTLTGTLLATARNKVAGSKVTAVALTGNQDNYVWPVTDTVIFTTTGNNNYSITGVVARAPGSIINLVNQDTTPNTLTISHNVTSTATNRFNINAGTDFVEGQDDAKSFIATGGAATGWSEN